MDLLEEEAFIKLGEILKKSDSKFGLINPKSSEFEGEISDFLITFILNSKDKRTLECYVVTPEDFNFMNEFKKEFYAYKNISRKINEKIVSELLTLSNSSDLYNFFKDLTGPELLYFCYYNTPLNYVTSIGRLEKDFWKTNLFDVNPHIISVFENTIFNSLSEDLTDRVRAITGTLESLNDSNSYNYATRYGDSLLSNFYTNYLLREVFQYEGDEATYYNSFLNIYSDMALYYLLKIYKLYEVKVNMPIFKKYYLTNEEYRLLYEEYIKDTDAFHSLPLEWHLEFISERPANEKF